MVSREAGQQRLSKQTGRVIGKSPARALRTKSLHVDCWGVSDIECFSASAERAANDPFRKCSVHRSSRDNVNFSGCEERSLFDQCPVAKCRLPTAHLLARNGGLSTALNPEFFRTTALLASKREVLKFPSEQNRCNTDNDHFRSALRARRRSRRFRWHFLTGHVISFRRNDATVPIRQLIRPQTRA
jgi:hypothetical protein